MDLSTLDAASLRTALPHFLAGYIADPDAAATNVRRMQAVVAAWSDADALAVRDALAHLGSEFRVYPALPAARNLARAWCRDVITAVEVVGAHHLREARDAGPTVVVGNHLTYFDTTATDAALAWSGHADIADALVTAAGPKVYETLFRRFAALCLNTLPVPQSTRLEGTAELSPRELATRAIASLKASRSALADGLSLQIYPEGTRSRTKRLGPFLRGVYRYVDVPGCHIVPAALSGTQRMMPVGEQRLTPAPMRVAYGEPIPVHAHANPRDALAAAWHGVAALLPPELQPEAGTPSLA